MTSSELQISQNFLTAIALSIFELEKRSKAQNVWKWTGYQKFDSVSHTDQQILASTQSPIALSLKCCLVRGSSVFCIVQHSRVCLRAVMVTFHHYEVPPRRGRNHQKPGLGQLCSLLESTLQTFDGLSIVRQQVITGTWTDFHNGAKSPLLPLDAHMNAVHRDSLLNTLLLLAMLHFQDNFD